MRRYGGLVTLLAALLAGCGSAPTERANALGREGRYAEALAVLEEAAAQETSPQAYRAPRQRLRQIAVSQWLAQAERARAAGRLPEAADLLRQAAALDAEHPRVAALQRDIEKTASVEAQLARAREHMRQGRGDQARALLEQVLRETPSHAAAQALVQQLTPPPTADALPPALSAAYGKPVTLEFRDAPIKGVFEALARGHDLNFVFDREVRGDNKVTLFLRDVPLDEALRVLLSTQQLERKLLNANTLLIYPNTPVKQREHQDLVTRTLYLANADVKSTVALIRTIAKTQDIHADERLSAIVVRDAPAVIRIIEDLVAAVDLPEAEVMIEVEVLEVGSTQVDELGLQWPTSASYGLLGVDGGAAPATIPLTAGVSLRGSILNPAAVATLRGTNGRNNTLANPTIRARSREKAQVLVGDRLPVFTTTSTANVGVTASVTYLDVGIKLDVEPTVQLDNDVSIRVTLEVSTLGAKVSGPAGSVAYEVGTRRTTTSLRLKDGETQMLAGLIKDEDRRHVDGVPGLAGLPFVGRLFGVHADTRNKTEVVLLMTPRVIRNLPLPGAHITWRAGGTAADPGAAPLRLAARAAAGAALVGAAPAAAPPTAAVATPAPATLEVSTSGTAAIGETVAVSLKNRSTQRQRGELQFDANLFQNAAAGPDTGSSAPFDIAPGGDFVLVLRVLPAAAGQRSEVSVLPAGGGRAEVSGSTLIEVRP